jgi:hypothetical protein
MECNHIVPEAEQGPNTLENCIPLCFDCHAEVGAYNPKHPKGNKFSGSELRAHRDNWFRKVAASPALTSATNTIEVDRKVFEKIRELLPSSQAIAFIRTNNFAGFSFRMSMVDPFYEFERWARLPDSEFLDADLEHLRSNLAEAVEDFTDLITGETYTASSPDYASVPPEWESEQPARFDRVVSAIHSSAAKVCVAFDALIRSGRRKLNVP